VAKCKNTDLAYSFLHSEQKHFSSSTQPHRRLCHPTPSSPSSPASSLILSSRNGQLLYCAVISLQTLTKSSSHIHQSGLEALQVSNPKSVQPSVISHVYPRIADERTILGTDLSVPVIYLDSLPLRLYVFAVLLLKMWSNVQ